MFEKDDTTFLQNVKSPTQRLAEKIRKLQAQCHGNRSAGRRRRYNELLQQATPDFIPPTLWPRNSPDLNPVYYKIRCVMQEKMCKSKVRDIDDLREPIERAWNDLNQCIISEAVATTNLCLHQSRRCSLWVQAVTVTWRRLCLLVVFSISLTLD